jgi:large subunit ribosomal protein L25
MFFEFKPQLNLMSDITETVIKVQERELYGSSPSKNLRAEGKIPAVFYGKNILKHYSVDDSKLRSLLRSSGGTLSLLELEEPGGSKELALLKEMQVHSVNDRILHLDFVQVTRGQTLETKVPLELVGESPGVKSMGGILEVHQNEILVRCRPSQLPKSLQINIENLELGNSLQLKDIELSEGVELVGDLDSNIVTCVGSASGRADAGDAEEVGDEELAAEQSDSEEANSENSNSDET